MHNIGTVPTYKTHNVGAVPTYKTHNIGTELSYELHHTQYYNQIKGAVHGWVHEAFVAAIFLF